MTEAYVVEYTIEGGLPQASVVNAIGPKEAERRWWRWNGGHDPVTRIVSVTPLGDRVVMGGMLDTTTVPDETDPDPRGKRGAAEA